jgi:fermentation-respiration switch protein FrsA (DUF1100 family)
MVAANGMTGGYNIPSYWLLNSSFDNISKIADTNQQLFIIAGEEDMLFPPQDHTVKLFNKAKEPKHHMIVPGFGHSFQQLFRLEGFSFIFFRNEEID